MKRAVHNEMAKFAYDRIGELKECQKSEFRSLARSFPSMVQINGLAAAVAFLSSKNKNNAHGVLYDMIDKWTLEHLEIAEQPENSKQLKKAEQPENSKQPDNSDQTKGSKGTQLRHPSDNQLMGGNHKDGLMERILGLDNMGYRIYTNEIMNLCLWIKRFAEGMLAEEGTGQTAGKV